jgi:uncharacterized protein (DUF4415 family)
VRSAKGSSQRWTDPDDAPELTDDILARAEIRRGDEVLRRAQGTLTRRGRPPLEHPKQPVTLRLDHDLVERLRASGPGWQSRVNDILRKAIGG